jgi:hypothetical protein
LTSNLLLSTTATFSEAQADVDYRPCSNNF